MAEAAEKVRIAPRAVGEYLAQIAMVFAVQFAAGKLGNALPLTIVPMRCCPPAISKQGTLRIECGELAGRGFNCRW